jgi:hypothetical protein
MPRNSGGTYSLPPSNPVVTNTPISSAGWANPTLADIAQALTDSISKNGVTTPTTNLPMGTFNHTGVGPATARDQYGQAGQIQDGQLTFLNKPKMPTQDAYTNSTPVLFTAFPEGMLLNTLFFATNATVAPTLNVNGAGPSPLRKTNGAALAIGQLKVNTPYIIQRVGGDWRVFIDATGLTAAEVVASLGYTPLDVAGSNAMTALLQLANAAPVSALHATPKGYVDGAIAAAVAGRILVDSFNTRTGAVTLTAADVNAALTFTPANSAGQVFTGGIKAPTVELNAITVGVSGGVAVTWPPAQSQILTFVAAGTIASIAGIPVGNLLRLTLIDTNIGPTAWPSNVKWPGGTPTDLTTGALKRAIVVIENDGTNLLASAAVY